MFRDILIQILLFVDGTMSIYLVQLVAHSIRCMFSVIDKGDGEGEG